MHYCHRLKEMYVLLSSDGPYRNVLKLKPPMCFNKDNVDELVTKLEIVLTEIENGELDLEGLPSTSSPDSKVCLEAESVLH